MSFFDEIAQRAQNAAQNTIGRVTDVVSNRLGDAIVSIGPAPRGNQTAAQIESGQHGEAPQPNIPAVAGVSLSGKNLVLIGGAIVASIFFFSRRR